MARQSRRHKRSSSSRRRSPGPLTWVMAASIWILPAAAGYVIYRTLTDDLSSTAASNGSNSGSDPVATVAPIQHGPVQQLEVSSSLILNPESAEFYKRIVNKRRQQEEEAGAARAEAAIDSVIEILGPGWLLSQRSNAFTIQFLTSTNMDELVDFSEHFSGDQPATIYPYKQSGDIVSYGLARGVFDTFDSAQLALKTYSSVLLRHQPWIRPISQVSRQIRTFNK